MSAQKQDHLFLESVQDAVSESLTSKKPLLVLATGRLLFNSLR